MGSGFKYLMDSIAVGDGKLDQSSNLTRYYAESGTPPGVFLGAGLADLDGGNGVEVGSQVSEDQLQNMLGLIVDPIRGSSFSAASRSYGRRTGSGGGTDRGRRTVQEAQAGGDCCGFRPHVLAVEVGVCGVGLG
jgi:hypothetical protein